MAQWTRIFQLSRRGLAVVGLSLLLASCAAPTRPLSVPATHPASVDAPETPVPPPSTTLQVPAQAGDR